MFTEFHSVLGTMPAVCLGILFNLQGYPSASNL